MSRCAGYIPATCAMPSATLRSRRAALRPRPLFSIAIPGFPLGETLTDEQWRQVADREEQRLGFTSQPRACPFHIDQESGEKHMHIAWSRIARTEDGNLYAIDPGLYKNKLMGVRREYE